MLDAPVVGLVDQLLFVVQVQVRFPEAPQTQAFQTIPGDEQ